MSTFRLSADYLPDSIYNSLSRKSLVVLRKLNCLFNLRKEVISLEYATITPSLRFIAESTGLSKYQVSRAFHEIQSAGLISLRQQRTKTGEWRTNIIALGQHFKALWKAFQDKKKNRINNGLHKSANIENLRDSEDNYFAEFVKLMKNIGSGGARPAPA